MFIFNKKFWAKLTLNDFLLALLIFLFSRFLIIILIKLNVPEVFNGSGFELVRADLNGRFGSWDGDLYRKIAESGYRFWGDLAVYSFLPGWPFILRVLNHTFGIFKVVEWGLILNQILILPVIYMFIKLLRKLNFNTFSLANIVLLILFYPSSVFFNFNYNETVYLFGVLGVILLWVSKRYNLAALATLPFVLVRFNIIVVLYGLAAYAVLNYAYNHFKANYVFKETNNSEYLKKLISDGFQVLKSKVLTIILLILAPLPFFMWFEIMKSRFGENLYFISQKNYFGRETKLFTGVFESFLDGLKIFREVFKYDKAGQWLTLNLPLGTLILGGIYGFHTWFTNNSKLIQKISLVVVFIYILVTFKYGAADWNNPLSYQIYLNILPAFIILAGLIGLWKNPNLRILILPTLFSLYLPLSTSTFVSMNRYLIQAFPLIIGYYSLFMVKNKYLGYTVLLLFIAGYALLLHRFTHFQWAG
jgi:hypothetical protein